MTDFALRDTLFLIENLTLKANSFGGIMKLAVLGAVLCTSFSIAQAQEKTGNSTNAPYHYLLVS